MMNALKFKSTSLLLFLAILFSGSGPGSLRANPAEPLFALYNEANYKDLLNTIQARNIQEPAPELKYLEFKASLKSGNLDECLSILSVLEREVDYRFNDLILYEKLNYYTLKDDPDELLKFISDIHDKSRNSFISERIVAALIKRHSEVKNKVLLRQVLDQLLPGLRENPSKSYTLLSLYVGLFENGHPKRSELAVKVWEYGDVTKLSQDEKTIEKYVSERAAAYQSSIVNHFANQKSYKNYSYITRELPGYLNGFTDKRSELLKELRDVYIYSLKRKHLYSRTIKLLVSDKARRAFGFTRDEVHEHLFDIYLRINRPEKALDIIRQKKESGDTSTFDLWYFVLGSHYYRHDLHREALTYFSRVNEGKISTEACELMKWKLWRIYQMDNNVKELKKIAAWADKHSFSDDEIAAKFCYWKYKLELEPAENLGRCYLRFPLTYYGLHSGYLENMYTDSIGSAPPKPLLTINKKETAPDLKTYLSMIYALYSIGEKLIADSIVRQNLNTSNFGFLIQVADLLLQSGQYHQLQYLVHSRFTEMLEGSRSARKLLLPYFYPKAYRDKIAKLVEKTSVPENLILAVMREESHFNPEIESVAGALGLMQLMPKTAHYIGKTIGLKIKTEELTQPDLNMRLGSAYLRRLLKRYDGNVFYTLAAYNGGPTNVRRWIRKTDSRDIDEFVETITFIETKNYVRKVMKSYYLYEIIYGKSD